MSTFTFIYNYNFEYNWNIYTWVFCNFLKTRSRPAVKWLGKPAAELKVPGSNPGKGMDVKLPVLGPHQWLRSKTGRGDGGLRNEPGTRFIPQSHLSALPFEVFRGFLRTRVNTG